MTFHSINPTNGEPFAAYEEWQPREVQDIGKVQTVLELGGSDPYVILEDADIEVAANVSTKGRLVNSGQSCNCGQAFYRRRGSAARVRGAICRTHEHHQDG
jgi:Aldehyde dehydrogenase family